MDDAEVQILLEWKERGRATLESNKIALAQLNADLAYRDALRAAGVIAADAETASTQTSTVATAENADAQVEDAAATDENAASQAGLASLLTGVSIPAWLAQAAAIALATAALSPFLIAGASAIVIATAFAVGATGAALALAGAAVTFGAAGAVLFLFASQTDTYARTIADLKHKFTPLVDALEKGVKPMVVEVSKFIQSLIPLISHVGLGIEKWFGGVLPGALRGISKVIKDLTPDFEAFGKFLAHAFGSANFGAIFEQLTRFGLGALEGLITNLLNLSNWFEQRLPAYGPVAKQIFGAVGSAVQGVGYWVGKLSDWLVAHWPEIVSNAKTAWDGLSKAWTDSQPELQWIATNLLPLLPPLLKQIADNTGAWGPVILQAVAALIIIAGAILAVTAAIEGMMTWIENVGASWNDFVIGFINGVNNLISAYNSLPAPLRGGGIVPYVQLPGQGGAANPNAGRAGGTKTNVTINVNGSGDPHRAALHTVRMLRTALQP